jgi:hypothetical protein
MRKLRTVLKIIDNMHNVKDIVSEFEKAFSDLKNLGEVIPSAKKTYVLLLNLNSGTSDQELEELLVEIGRIQYASNTNDYFYFYFPIVTYILFYKPNFEKYILKYLVGPNFANGTKESNDMIALIIGSMQLKLEENSNYLTKESKYWIMNELPKLEKQIEREIQVCWKELNG